MALNPIAMPRSGIIRFSYACALFLLALLSVFRAPQYHLWMTINDKININIIQS